MERLFDITRRARLVQSFEADAGASVPVIWEQRLSASSAADRWIRHRGGLWWLIWLDDGEPVLALPTASDPSSVDLYFADELHRSSFDQLPLLNQRDPSSLEQSCLQLLTSGTAVQWQPSGLASISGSLFPILASISHGCLSVELQGNRLMAVGPVAPRPFASLQKATTEAHSKRVLFGSSSTYLELNSAALQPLLGPSLSNPLIAEELSNRYGLPQELRDALLAAPLVLRVGPLSDGPFRASIQVRLMLPAGRIERIKESLDAVSTALLQRGLQRQQRRLLMVNGQPSNRAADVWLDSSGAPIGGWSIGTVRLGQVEMLMALGDSPTLGPSPLKRQGQQHLRMRGRPNELARLGWLGTGWPQVIRNASRLELEMTALPKQQQPGWLQLQLELP